MSGNRMFNLFAWLLLGVAAFSVVLSVLAMLMIGIPEPSFLGFAAVAAGAYGRRLMINRQTAVAA
jgi:hypothetical protein